MKATIRAFALAGLFLATQTAVAAESSPVGAWRAAGDCFLSAFNLRPDGRAETRYLSGERDDNARWTYEGGILAITSEVFRADTFEGGISGDRIDAEFTWHDVDRDELFPQDCAFDRFIPGAGT